MTAERPRGGFDEEAVEDWVVGLARTLTVVVPEPPDAETAGAAGEALLEISKDCVDSDPIVHER